MNASLLFLFKIYLELFSLFSLQLIFFTLTNFARMSFLDLSSSDVWCNVVSSPPHTPKKVKYLFSLLFFLQSRAIFLILVIVAGPVVVQWTKSLQLYVTVNTAG